MKDQSATRIGSVESVKGAIVTVRLRSGNLPGFLMIEGHSYRIGQVGAFVRIPVGYTQLYGVCTLVGAAAAPTNFSEDGQVGQRWLSVTLFGESLGGEFERGVSQYPTIDDEVHLVLPEDMRIIYGSTDEERAITIGHIAATSGITGSLDLGKLVTRHFCVVGSSGSGKSNLVAVLLEAIATQGFPSGRVLVIDPHGEYSSAVGEYGKVFRVNPKSGTSELPLYIPFWALPFEELQAISFGQMQTSAETAVRDEVTLRRRKATEHLENSPPESTVTSDSPIPFSIKKLWFDLDDFERTTYRDNNRNVPEELTRVGNPEELISNLYPAPSPGSQAPFSNPRPRGITKQLELLRSRLQDSRFKFLFEPGNHSPDSEGKIETDLDELVASWVGHEKPVTILDVSGAPSEILATIVGTLLRVVYDTLFWAMDLDVSGRNQPLLVILEEAHLFLNEGDDSAAHRTITKIAKEGRKYGIGLGVVSQRPSEVDSTVLSQCGTLISLRLSNSSDRQKVESAMPDDLGPLAGMLPALRTGEGLVIGEAMPIPSRIQFYKARTRPRGDDPEMPSAWRNDRPDTASYKYAIENWRYKVELNHEKEEK